MQQSLVRTSKKTKVLQKGHENNLIPAWYITPLNSRLLKKVSLFFPERTESDYMDRPHKCCMIRLIIALISSKSAALKQPFPEAEPLSLSLCLFLSLSFIREFFLCGKCFNSTATSNFLYTKRWRTGGEGLQGLTVVLNLSFLYTILLQRNYKSLEHIYAIPQLLGSHI